MVKSLCLTWGLNRGPSECESSYILTWSSAFATQLADIGYQGTTTLHMPFLLDYFKKSSPKYVDSLPNRNSNSIM